MILILLGAPGCGKGTISKLFQERLNFCHISTGEIIRKTIALNNEFGEMLRQIITKGELVSDEIVLKLLCEKLNECGSDIILDGFPRTLFQAKKLDEIAKIDKVIYIDTPYDVIKERLAGRRICQNCGKVYNVNLHSMNSCDCGGKLIQREDDLPHVIEERFKIYEEETFPLIEFYSNQDKLIKVKSSSSSNDTFNEILSFLEIKWWLLQKKKWIAWEFQAR